MNLQLKDILTFRRMLTPLLIKLIFWVGIMVCCTVGILDLLQAKWAIGALVLTLGPCLVRLACEALILFYQINNTLLAVLRRLDHREDSVH